MTHCGESRGLSLSWRLAHAKRPRPKAGWFKRPYQATPAPIASIAHKIKSASCFVFGRRILAAHRQETDDALERRRVFIA
jgi:hypothetical protein